MFFILFLKLCKFSFLTKQKIENTIAGDTKGASGSNSNTLFIELCANYMGVFSLWKFIKLYIHDMIQKLLKIKQNILIY